MLKAAIWLCVAAKAEGRLAAIPHPLRDDEATVACLFGIGTDWDLPERACGNFLLAGPSRWKSSSCRRPATPGNDPTWSRTTIVQCSPVRGIVARDLHLPIFRQPAPVGVGSTRGRAYREGHRSGVSPVTGLVHDNPKIVQRADRRWIVTCHDCERDHHSTVPIGINTPVESRETAQHLWENHSERTGGFPVRRGA